MPHRKKRLSDAPSVIVTGDFAHHQYEPDFCAALRTAGANVVELGILPFFGPFSAMSRIQRKFVLGPGILTANLAVIETCRRTRAQWLLAWRTPWLHPKTIASCQRLGTRVALYNNDDPFGADRDFRIWRTYRRLIPYADLCFSYRSVNVVDYRSAGARQVEMLRSWFNPALHRPVELSPSDVERFSSDVVFVGHLENDGRLAQLEALARTGLKLRLYGPGWEAALARSSLQSLLPVREIVGDEYTKAISAAKIALVFLSGRNRDQYTRRCFEIPAIGTFMLAPRTGELESMYQSEAECAFFNSTQELCAQAVRYCSNSREREAIAAAGRIRCLRDGNDVISRARGFLEALQRADTRLRPQVT